MKLTLVGKFAITLVAFVIISISVFSFAFIAKASQNSPSVLTNQTVPLVSEAHLVGQANPQQQLNLSIGLQLRNQQELQTLLREMYAPNSLIYHHFLSPQQFVDEFGPTVEQQQQVTSYLQQEGFQITHISSNRLLIDASASVTQAEAAFKVSINNYKLGANAFYANANAPTIPGSLTSIIASIGGLDNSVRMHPLYHLQPQIRTQPHAGPDGGFAPADLNGAYDANPLLQSGAQGNNQTVAVFELDGYQSSDVTQYFQQYNLGSPSISNVLVDSFDGSAGAGAIEVELDIEVVAAMAPKANQIVYMGPNSTQGVNDTYNQIVTDKKAQIATISWGECESQSGNAELQTLDNILSQGSAEGIAMYAASGDSGAYDCSDTNLAVDSPAGDPNITGVGGTNLQLNNGAYGSESVWSNPSDTQRSPEGSGGGGGISSYFKEPSWQTGPGVQNQYSNGNREVPDVSADADPATGYSTYCTVSAAGCPSSGWITVGGTSAAAPLWAGSTALINEYLQNQQKSRMGFANPVLYGLENATQQYPPFHDVTSGTNLYYPATSGYDEASGWGSPDIYNIARDVAGGGTTPPPTPTPNPSPTSTPIPTPTTQPSPSPTAPAPTSSAIQNGGFEQGSTPWKESSISGYEIVDTANPHTGGYSAFLCGYSSCNDKISQGFVVPSNVSNVTISYWWDAQTSHLTHRCMDTFTVVLLNASGKTIGKVQSACNANATGHWQQVNFNASSLLSSYAGQSVKLVFDATTSSSWVASSFFVDDVNVSEA
jgi:kumamolisin